MEQEIRLYRFGSIFEFQENWYVYLGYDPETGKLFAAKILDERLTRSLQQMSMRYATRPNHPLCDGLALCFCILTTDEVENRAASFHRTGDVNLYGGISPLEKALNEADIAKLKDMILKDKAMPLALVNIIKALNE